MKHFYLGAMAVAGCVSLAACVSFANMDAGLQRLMGHDVHDAIDVIGYPTSQAEIAGDTVYDWYVQSNGMITSRPRRTPRATWAPRQSAASPTAARMCRCSGHARFGWWLATDGYSVGSTTASEPRARRSSAGLRLG